MNFNPEYNWFLMEEPDFLGDPKLSISPPRSAQGRIPNDITTGEFVVMNCGTKGRLINYALGRLPDWQSVNKLMFQLYVDIGSIADPAVDRPMSDDLSLAVTGMGEVVQTNVAFAAHVHHINRLVFVLSSRTAESYTYGVAHGRASHFFWRYYLPCVREGVDYVPLQMVQKSVPDGYRDLGHPERSGDTLSERILLGLKEVTDRSKETLWKVGSVRQCVMLSRGSFCMPQEVFIYILGEVNRLVDAQRQAIEDEEGGADAAEGDDLKIEEKRRTRHQEIPLPHLAGLKTQYRTKTTTIVATGRPGFDILRKVFGSTFGVGVKQRFPANCNIKDPVANPRQMDNDTLVTMVDIQPPQINDLDMEGAAANVDAIASSPAKPNLIKLEYDHQLRKAKLSFRVRSKPQGTARGVIDRYIAAHAANRNDVGSGAGEQDTVQIGMSVFGRRMWYHDDAEDEDERDGVFSVIHLNPAAQLATIRNDEDSTLVKDVSYQYCKDNDINN